MSNVTPAKSQDQQHLELLAIFHYIFGGLGALCACFPLMYLGIGVAMLTGAFKGGSDGPPEEMGWIFVVIGALLALLGWTMSACIILAGRKLTRHESPTFCLVVAALMCLSIPLGTALGVFTIIVLMRPSVKELFESHRR
ncbi:MAG: hypothetical protein HZA46_04635 [Planctomycetales bacterium]|nr:hypothetical protein [Planctomycetales bacterium]